SQSKHTIYGEPNAQDELVIPDYQIGSAHKPQGSEVLEASYINFRESLGADFFALVMNKFNAPESTASYVDKVSILKTPQEIRALEA
ncbi:hypothetical protein J0J27_23240, partial [Vibrio vulnificus]|uniref:hypothetical protein n=1 Tax=Vibrio vulnificus TaxID=672 RepID=UPI0019D42229